MLANTEPHSAASTQASLMSLNEKWDALTNKSMSILQNLEAAKLHANSRGNEFDKWALWLEDVISELSTTRPVGGLPETAHAQLDEFRVLKAEVEAKRDPFEAQLRAIDEHLSTADSNNERDSWLQQRHLQIKKDWDKVQVSSSAGNSSLSACCFRPNWSNARRSCARRWKKLSRWRTACMAWRNGSRIPSTLSITRRLFHVCRPPFISRSRTTTTWRYGVHVSQVGQPLL